MAGSRRVKSKSTTTKKQNKRKVNVLHQRLGSLTYHQACQMLGDDGAKLIREGGRVFEILSDRDVFLGGDLFRVRVEDPALESGVAIATITLRSARAKQLHSNCDQCKLACTHLGAALEFLLDAKSVLGLAMPPDESVPLENLTEDELLQRAMAEREERAKQQKMLVRSVNPEKPWVDYVVVSKQSGRSYRVALRGLEDVFAGAQTIGTKVGARTKRSAGLHLREVEAEARSLTEKRQKVSEASGTLITAALSLAGELIGNNSAAPPNESTVNKLTKKLSECVDRDSEGRPQLTISLANENALKGLASSLARLLDSS